MTDIQECLYGMQTQQRVRSSDLLAVKKRIGLFVHAVSASATGVSKEPTVVYCTYREFGMSASGIGGHRIVDIFGTLGP